MDDQEARAEQRAEVRRRREEAQRRAELVELAVSLAFLAWSLAQLPEVKVRLAVVRGEAKRTWAHLRWRWWAHHGWATYQAQIHVKESGNG